MNLHFRTLLLIAMALGTIASGWGQSASPRSKPTTIPNTQAPVQSSEQQVIALLREFLSKVNDPAMHERFWADDVVYTGSNGKFRAKTEIVENVRKGGLAKPGEPQPTFSAEDITTHVFGDTVVVAFRLVHHAGDVTENYRNTGTFLRRNGQWQVVAWQATKVPEQTPEETK